MDITDLPPADGKFAGTVKVGEKGQIVIPKGARDMFGIKSGDTLLLLADIDQGIVIVRQGVFDQFIAQALSSTATPSTALEEETEGEEGEQ